MLMKLKAEAGMVELKILFDNPYVISQRMDEFTLHPSFFLKPSVAISEGYPQKAFVYSQL